MFFNNKLLWIIIKDNKSNHMKIFQYINLIYNNINKMIIIIFKTFKKFQNLKLIIMIMMKIIFINRLNMTLKIKVIMISKLLMLIKKINNHKRLWKRLIKIILLNLLKMKILKFINLNN